MAWCASPANIFQVPRPLTRLLQCDPRFPWWGSDLLQTCSTHPCTAAIVVRRRAVTVWQGQQPSEVTGTSMQQHEKIRCTFLTLNWDYFCMLLSHRCDRIRLSLFYNPNSWWHSHPGIRRASWIMKQSQCCSTGCHPNHANGTGTSQRWRICNRHKYLTLIADTADCDFSEIDVDDENIGNINRESRRRLWKKREQGYLAKIVTP